MEKTVVWMTYGVVMERMGIGRDNDVSLRIYGEANENGMDSCYDFCHLAEIPFGYAAEMTTKCFIGDLNPAKMLATLLLKKEGEGGVMVVTASLHSHSVLGRVT